MKKKEFAVIAFNLEYKIFIVYIALISSTPLINIDMHLFCKPQIASLIVEEAFTKVFAKYTNFVNMFFLDLTSKLFKFTRINDYTIKLVDG